MLYLDEFQLVTPTLVRTEDGVSKTRTGTTFANAALDMKGETVPIVCEKFIVIHRYSKKDVQYLFCISQHCIVESS
jgi:hypothetical protein